MGGVVVGERAGAASQHVVATELGDPVQFVDTGFGGLQRLRIDVGGIDDAAV